jgi:hypothetical protein
MARRAHILDIFLESPRRAGGAHLARGIDQDGDGVVNTRGYAANSSREEKALKCRVSDPDAAGLAWGARATDQDVAAEGRGEIYAGFKPYGDVVVAASVVR